MAVRADLRIAPCVWFAGAQAEPIAAIATRICPGAILAADAAATVILRTDAFLTLVGVLRPGAAAFASGTIAESDLWIERGIHADGVVDADATSAPATAVAQARPIGKALANALVRSVANTLVRGCIASEIAVSSPAIKVTAAGIRPTRANTVAAVELIGPTRRTDTLSPSADLIAVTCDAAATTIVVIFL